MDASTMTSQEAAQEKKHAAFTSIIAAIFLTGMKIIVGIITNSLGVISEALHSSFDLLAAGMTYVAVHFAAIPPDKDHPYGHGKVENLSALVQSLLLFITCGWILWEAADRLFFNPVAVEPSIWAVLVMVISIVVDINRSRMLAKMAKKHNSQALEADALHFSTDILSSAVVLVGIGGLYLAKYLPPDSPFAPWLVKADSLAAVAVSFIIIRVSYELAKRAVNVLLDASDLKTSVEIKEIIKDMPVVKKIDDLRIRHSGSDVFVDMTLLVDNSLLLPETEHIRKKITDKVQEINHRTELSIVFKPETDQSLDSISALRGMAVAHGLLPHSIEIFDLDDAAGKHRQMVELHAVFEPDMTMEEAHDRVDLFENALTEENPDTIIFTHIEPKGTKPLGSINRAVKDDSLTQEIKKVVKIEKSIYEPHSILISSHDWGRRLSFHCYTGHKTTVADAYEATQNIQLALRAIMPDLAKITIHVEPKPDKEPQGTVFSL